jgi:hypothetical protein
MKKVLVTLVVFALALPAWAAVNISCTADGNQVTVNYAVSGEPNKVSGFGLDITVDSGAKITSISDLNSKYWVYPGSIVILNGEVNDVGTPIGDPVRFPGTLGGLGTNGISIEMGALYYPTGDNSPNAPPLSGTVLKFRVDKDCAVTIQENAVRGGVVLTKPSIDPTVNFTGCVVTSECYPKTYVHYADWKLMNKSLRNCWCAKPIGSGYQCDGDADGVTQGVLKYRVFTNDFNILVANWKKVITDAALNPCADFDRLPQGVLKYRVFTNDFNILVGNWKKTDALLPGNCPRP